MPSSPTRGKLPTTPMDSSPESSNDSKRTFALGATYQVKSRFHGRGKVLFAWGNNPEDIDCPKYLASSGTSKVIHVFTKDSDERKNLGIVDQIMPPGSSICTAISWDSTGQVLCCAQENSSILVFWYAKEKKYKTYDIGVRDVSIIAWSSGIGSASVSLGSGEGASSFLIAVGTGKGSVCFVDAERLTHSATDSRKRRRVEIGKWNGSGTRFAFCCQDRRDIQIAQVDGTILSKIKTKSPVSALLFSAAMPVVKDERHIGSHRKTVAVQRGEAHGVKRSRVSDTNRNSNNEGKEKQNRSRRKSKSKIHSGIISANLQGDCLCFYDVDSGSNTNSIELTFQTRYGKIIGYAWMSKYILLVGFSGGYVVVLNMQDYNRELFCVELPAVQMDSDNSIYNVNYSANTGAATASHENQGSFANNSVLGADERSAANNNSEGALHLKYFSHAKVAAVYTRTHVTFIELKDWENNRADVMHLNFGGSDDHEIVMSSNGTIISVFNPEGNVWHYTTNSILQNQRTEDIDLMALNDLFVSFLLKPISSFSLLFSMLISTFIIVSLIASALNTSPSNVVNIIFGINTRTL